MDKPPSTNFLVDLSHIGLNKQSLEQHLRAVQGIRNIVVPTEYEKMDTGLYGDCKAVLLSATGLDREPFGDTPFIELIAIYSKKIHEAKNAGANLIILRGASCLSECRAAVLGAGQWKVPIIVILEIDQYGETVTDTDYLAALVTLQGLGACGFVIGCKSNEDEMLEDFLLNMRVHATIPVGIMLSNKEENPTTIKQISEKLSSMGAGIIVLDSSFTTDHLLLAGEGIALAKPCAPIKHEPIKTAACSSELFFFGENPVMSEEIECTMDMSHHIIEAEENGCDIIKVVVYTVDDAYLFGLNAHMSRLPIALIAHSEEALDSALIHYHGIALIDSLCELEDEVMEKYARLYNAIII